MRRSICSAAIVLVALAQSLHAQVSVTLAPTIGYYRPLGHFDAASVYATDLPLTPQGLSGTAIGGAAKAWFGHRFGAEIMASVARSTVPSIFSPEGPTPTTPAQVEMIVAQGMVTVAGNRSGNHLWVSAGPALIRHGGDAYSRYGSSAQPAGAVGAGAQLNVSRHLLATLDLSALMYTFDLPLPQSLRLNPGQLQHGNQTDALIQFGFGWILGN
ncbi:MAG TPA: hypothetical protein VGM20_10005 [Gemmatimonadales bacterium]|jgi:hypothetical protein